MSNQPSHADRSRSDRRGRLSNLCVRVFEWHSRRVEGFSARRGQGTMPGRYLGGLGAVPVHSHQITPPSAIAAGTAAPAAVQADHTVVAARAEESRRTRRIGWSTLAIGVVALGILGLAVRHLIFFVTRTDRSITELAVGLPVELYGVSFCAYCLAVIVGRREYHRRVLAALAGDLGGEWGIDDARPVAAWMVRNWPALSPPAFLCGDNSWATGTRGGRQVLVVLEQSDSVLVRLGLESLAAAFARREKADTQVPSGLLWRLSIFVASPSIAPQALDAPARELHELGYGVVPTQAGVYLFGVGYERSLPSVLLFPVLDRVLPATGNLGEERKESANGAE